MDPEKSVFSNLISSAALVCSSPAADPEGRGPMKSSRRKGRGEEKSRGGGRTVNLGPWAAARAADTRAGRAARTVEKDLAAEAEARAFRAMDRGAAMVVEGGLWLMDRNTWAETKRNLFLQRVRATPIRLRATRAWAWTQEPRVRTYATVHLHLRRRTFGRRSTRWPIGRSRLACSPPASTEHGALCAISLPCSSASL